MNIMKKLYFARWWLHPLLRDKYNLLYSPSGSAKTLSEYYALFNDPDDIRNGIWLTGKQYYEDGSPIMIETTKSGYDSRYERPVWGFSNDDMHSMRDFGRNWNVFILHVSMFHSCLLYVFRLATTSSTNPNHQYNTY